MTYTAEPTKKALKSLKKLSLDVQQAFYALRKDLEATGPHQGSWQGFSKLPDGSYHCHLNYRYVACWRHEKNSITIEIYYVGSRENAPY